VSNYKEEGAPKPTQQEVRRPEVVNMTVTCGAELIRRNEYPFPKPLEFEEVDIHDRPLKKFVSDLADYLTGVGHRVIGLRTFKRIEGTVMDEGKRVNVRSENYEYSGIAYINGKVQTIEQFTSTIPERRTKLFDDTNWTKAIDQMRKEGLRHAVLMRDGGVRGFILEKDSIIRVDLPEKEEL
jgi:hypothetical protein